MRILVVNAGSSSLKVSLLGPEDQLLGEYDDLGAVPEGDVDAIGHRVVHGGSRSAPALLDDAVVDELAGLTALAPLHQPPALEGMAQARRRWPALPHVACFDTAFHATIPAGAATYALPREWRALSGGVRKYGFHGLSHRWASGRAAELAPGARRVVVAHLGAGASLTAVVDGASVDTTMGFTPTAGLVMAKRPGDVDPGLVTWLITSAGLPAEEVAEGLVQRSGLKGLADTEDMREVLARADAGDADATLALDAYLHRLCGLLGSMVAAARGLDALVFTGGVGERSPAVRAAVVERLGFLGLALDAEANAAAPPDGEVDVSAAGATARTLVVHAREDLEIARQVRNVVSG